MPDARIVPDMLDTSAEFVIFLCVHNIAAYSDFALHIFIAWTAVRMRAETQDYLSSEFFHLVFIGTPELSTYFLLLTVV